MQDISDLDALLAEQEDPSLAFARFASTTARVSIPESVRRRAAHLILDATGIALASAKHDFAQRTLTAFAGLGERGTVPVIGMPARLSPRDAATVNGLLCHGLDFDDTHLGSIVHATASVFPAVLSTALMVGTSGRDILDAYITGMEVAARVGAVAKGLFHEVGFHPTSVAGVFGCAVAAGMLMGLSESELARAQGIALSMASGSLEFLEDGAWNKRLHPGLAAAGGITAAALARQGFVGVGRPLIGRFGLYRMMLGSHAAACRYELATEGLGSVWAVDQTAVKPFPACHFAHGCIDAALVLHQRIDPERIVSIETLVPAGVVQSVCEPAEKKKRPQNSYDAQFSVPYLTAAALIRGQVTLSEIAPDALADPAITALASKVRYSIDPDSTFPRAYSGEVRIVLDDGSTHTAREEVNRGAPDRPLADMEIVEKYRRNARTAISQERSDRIEKAILSVNDGDSKDFASILSW